jgi:hypothetical protein
MAQQSFASLAVLVALAFAVMALHGCASSAQTSVQIAGAVEETTPEFHGAAIGGDALRSRLGSDD